MKYSTLTPFIYCIPTNSGYYTPTKISQPCLSLPNKSKLRKQTPNIQYPISNIQYPMNIYACTVYCVGLFFINTLVPIIESNSFISLPIRKVSTVLPHPYPNSNTSNRWASQLLLNQVRLPISKQPNFNSATWPRPTYATYLCPTAKQIISIPCPYRRQGHGDSSIFVYNYRVSGTDRAIITHIPSD